MKKKLAFFAATFYLFLLASRISFADVVDTGNTSGKVTGLPNPLGTQSIEELFGRIAAWLFTVSIPLCAIMIIVGAFQIMFAGGNEEKVRTGKNTIVYTAVGFAIILSASGIIFVIKELFGVNCYPPGFIGPLPPGGVRC